MLIYASSGIHIRVQFNMVQPTLSRLSLDGFAHLSIRFEGMFSVLMLELPKVFS